MKAEIQPKPSPPSDQRNLGPEEIPEERAQRGLAPWRGLLWAEWFAHSKLLLVFILLWLSGVWLLPLFTHPDWILLLGILYVMAAGPAYGGGDLLEGCEEFSFALPATRGERYLARVLVGGGTFLILTVINLLTLGFDVPQVLARLYVGSGLIQPRAAMRPGLLYGLVLALPFCWFAFSFVFSALTHSRWVVLSAPLWSGLIALGTLQLGLSHEEMFWGRPTGFMTVPLLLVVGSVCVAVGYRCYARKEVGPPTIPIGIPARWWLWILLFLCGLGLGLRLLSSLARHYAQ